MPVLQRGLDKYNINKLRNGILIDSGECSNNSIRGIKMKKHPGWAKSHKLDFSDFTCRNNILHYDIVSSIQLSRIWLGQPIITRGTKWKLRWCRKSEVKNWVGTLFSISVQKYNGIYYKTGINCTWLKTHDQTGKSW